MSDELLCVQCQRRPVARLGGRFCSVACKTRYHAYIPKPLKAGICQHGGTVFTYKINARYCGRKCQELARYQRKRAQRIDT
jgi:hypothetical protein